MLYASTSVVSQYIVGFVECVSFRRSSLGLRVGTTLAIDIAMVIEPGLWKLPDGTRADSVQRIAAAQSTH